MHGRTPDKLPEWRVWSGLVLLLLGQISLFGCMFGFMQFSVPPMMTIPARIYIGLVVSLLDLGIASLVLGSASVIWQACLQMTAAAAIVVGCRVLIVPLFSHPRSLLGWTGAAGFLLLAFALCLGVLMSYLQRRFLKIGPYTHIKKHLQRR